MKLLKLRSASHKKYEELLLKKDELKAEAEEIQNEYSRVFGELKTLLFKERMECVRKKKVINYCQMMMIEEIPIEKEKMESFVDQAMKELNDTLQGMIDKNEESKRLENVDKDTLKKIKQIYFRIAKQIHPDMNPDLKDDATIKDLWNRTLVAQKQNQLKEIEEVEYLLKKYLANINNKKEDIEIPDIDEKIDKLNEEIEKIKTTEPYLYKYLLADEKAVEEEKQSILNELNEYKEYGEKLDNIIKEFDIKDKNTKEEKPKIKKARKPSTKTKKKSKK